MPPVRIPAVLISRPDALISGSSVHDHKNLTSQLALAARDAEARLPVSAHCCHRSPRKAVIEYAAAPNHKIPDPAYSGRFSVEDNTFLSLVGTRSCTSKPPPKRLRRASSPPWASATLRAMASPRPLPPVAALREGSMR